MPSLKIHCAISKKRTNKTYKALHEWIDDDKEHKGVNHRSKRHFYSKKLRVEIYNSFGGNEAVSEWLFHIALDNLKTSLKNDEIHGVSYRNFFKIGFRDNSFIDYIEKEFEDKEFDLEFDEDIINK